MKHRPSSPSHRKADVVQRRKINLAGAMAMLLFIQALAMGCAEKKTDRSYDAALYGFSSMRVDSSRSLQHTWNQKKILASRVVDNMESLAHWRLSTVYGKENVAALSLSSEKVFEGDASLKFVSPTKLDKPLMNEDRYWEWQFMTREFDRDDFSGFNRIAVQIYPRFKGHHRAHLLLILHNEGNVPDVYFREGIHTVMLENEKWNTVRMEIAHLPRDKVTGISLVYRLQGNEADAADTITFFADQLRMEKVDPDHYEGWDTGGEISFSHSGYNASETKTAFTSSPGPATFKIVKADDNGVVLEKNVKNQTSQVGNFNVFEFTELTTPGRYQIVYGDRLTKPFPIGDDVWLPSLEKSINLFFTERCGYALPGIHDVCHSDWYTVFKGDTLRMNGGWHDAGDLSQSYTNTSEAVRVLFGLARKYRGKDDKLSDRLLEEARWGLGWLHKNRFDDDQRIFWTVIDHWSDGRIGTVDDSPAMPAKGGSDLYFSILAEAEAALALNAIDASTAAVAKNNALQDWALVNANTPPRSTERLALSIEAGAKLFALTNDLNLKAQIVAYANTLMGLQQREPMPWKIPLYGFFYSNKNSDEHFGYSHEVIVASPIAGLVALCKLFPEHPQHGRWINCIKDYVHYLKTIAALTGPYGMVPARIYKLTNSPDDIQIRRGLRLDETHYLRMFPVWGPYRGNTTIALSYGIALAQAFHILREPTLRDLAQSQLEWVVGKNPFSQSLMYGEGYNFAPQYSPMCGDIVGGLPVGILTKGDSDVPYWQAAVFANYKELWVHPSVRWLQLLEIIQ